MSNIWWATLLWDMSVPAAYIVAGLLLAKYPPQEINGLIGFRTWRSMQNEQTWKFANAYAAKLLWRTGVVLIPISVGVLIAFLGDSSSTIGMAGTVICLAQCASVLVPIIIVEHELEAKYPQAMNPKAASTPPPVIRRVSSDPNRPQARNRSGFGS